MAEEKSLDTKENQEEITVSQEAAILPEDTPTEGKHEVWELGTRARPHKLKSDVALVAKALDNGWNVPRDLINDTLDRVKRLYATNELSPRDITAIGKMLATFQKVGVDIARLELGMPESNAEANLTIEIKKAPGEEDPGARVLRERYS